jgi:peroxiredoxin (alkyl hydroperoxide reductase subunit C)
MSIKLGKKFPDIETKTTMGPIKLPEYYMKRNKGFIFFSHPSDFTPVCTTEFVSIQENIKEIRKYNYELIGLSIDSMCDHTSWIEWININYGVEISFPIIEDLTREIAVKMDILNNASEDTSTTRAVVFVSKNGVIRVILDYPKEIGRNINEIIRIVKALDKNDKTDLFTPADWPQNNHLADRLLLEEDKIINDKDSGKMDLSSKFGWFRHVKNTNTKI